MAILETPYLHFNQDISRARALLDHADTLTESELRNDIMRGAWMMSVGALDAYFCDAYADLIARTLQAKQHQPIIQIPGRLNNLRVPVVAFLRASSNENWRWRVMARELIEDHTVLSIKKIKDLFNHFFEDANKLMGDTSFDSWVLHRDHKQRLFGISRTNYRATQNNARSQARKDAKKVFEKRYERIFQRRHDCIHNCDRPKVAIDQTIVTSTEGVRKVIYDVEFLVNRCQKALINEYPAYLQRLGFSGVTRNRVGAS
jgi:hypothetical protein